MEAFFALLALCAGNSPATIEFPAQRPATRSIDVFFDLPELVNGWVNNREAGDLRRYRAHYDVTVIKWGWWYPKSLTYFRWLCEANIGNSVHV